MLQFAYSTIYKQQKRSRKLNILLPICCSLSTMSSTNSKKGVALTPNEQLVHMELLKKKVCSLKDVTEVTSNYKTSRDTLSRLVGKGCALRVHRGYYAGVPLEYLDKNYEVDRYVLGHKVSNRDGAFAYHSALELHGVAHSDFNTIYYLRPKPLRPFEFQNIEYRYLTSQKMFGIKNVIREGVYIPVTDRERTFLDCVRRPDHCGGLEEVLKSIGTFHSLDYALLKTYLEKFGEQSLRQKIGYILSLLEDEMKVSEWLLRDLRKSIKNKIYYLLPQSKEGSGRIVNEWNLIVPKNIDEVMRFA